MAPARSSAETGPEPVTRSAVRYQRPDAAGGIPVIGRGRPVRAVRFRPRNPRTGANVSLVTSPAHTRSQIASSTSS